MSSMQRGQPVQASFELGSKKKFGKNLNKLQKPPAPPITNGASQKGSGSARNGLLLLSTKRSSSAGTAQGSGLLSSKPVQLPATVKPSSQPAAVRKESYTSAHDALIDAVMGASRSDSQKEPDAWKVVEKQPDEDKASPIPISPTRGQESPSFQSSAVPNDDDRNERIYQPEQMNNQRYGDRFDDSGPQRYNRHDSDDNWRISDTEERWTRGHQPPGEAGDDEQGMRMSMLARERAERRRHEEETRMKEQRDRATQRLRELDEKVESQPSEGVDDAHYDERGGDTNGFSPRPITMRSLFDPNKPYSSLVGGNSKSDGGLADAPADRPQDPAVKLIGNDISNQSIGPVIQLSSYEDRDRGESRNSTTTPRMLYDPKSGSMVAVGESKAKKVKPKTRREADKGDSGDALNNAKKKNKGRIEIAVNPNKDRRRCESIDTTSADDSKVLRPRSVKPPEPRLPRTCGVLYARDEKGNCYSVDGCDGDQGYGCHGVPGGRTRNPEAYAKFEEEHNTGTDNQGDYSIDIDDTEHGLQGYSSPEKTPDPVVAWVKPNEKIELLTGVQDSPTLQATAMPWAPSQAALSAAKEIRGSNGKVTRSVVSVDSMDKHREVEDICDDPDSFVGLGFDPSDMDDVMNSPSTRAHSARLDHLDLVALSLGVPASDSKRDRSIFAFGSSSTWGSSGNNNAPSDWAVLGTGGRIGAADTQAKSVGTPSFLSLSSNNTWGSAGLPGFGADQGAMTD
ncbi:hypothetical protein MHU86_18692 [Fragilaria crotonensis]|nr:hypothetical protein MHU86_18692 [Fragilaria crotonensis]